MYNKHAFSGLEDWRYKNWDGFTHILTYDFIKTIEPLIDLDSVKTVYDIGSRDGCQTMELSDWFVDAHIHSFEPVPKSYEYCLQQTDGRPLVTMHNIALSDVDGTIVFREIENGNVGASSLLKLNNMGIAWGGSVKEIPVTTSKINTFVTNKNSHSPDLLWMDVQGAELNVLRGCGEFLETVQAIHTEVGIEPLYEGGTSKLELIQYMTERGFVCVKEITNALGLEVDLVFVNDRYML